MARAQLANNASTTLAAGINNSVTSMSVAAGTGALFPVVSSYFYCTLAEGTLIEIVKVTARTTDTFTIVRAQDGTTAQAFTTAALVRLHLTAAVIAELQDIASKDASGGYPGLTLFKLNLRNAANTFTSWFTNAATAARTWTLPDKDGTVVLSTDLGTGIATALAVNAGSAGAPILQGGAASVTTLTARLTGVGGAPATSGTTQTYGSARFGTTSFTGVMDVGSGGTYVWMQATDTSDLSQKYAINLNPNGGNIQLGASTSAVTIPGTLAVQGATLDLITSGATLTVGVGANNGIVSAGVFTDRTKAFTGDALAEIGKITHTAGEIDHSTLPAFAQVELVKPIYEEREVLKPIYETQEVVKTKDIDGVPTEYTETVQVQTGEETVMEQVKVGEYTVTERDIGAMVSMLTVAVQQLTARLYALENKP